MANPRRMSLPLSSLNPSPSLSSSIAAFLKRPSAFLFALFLFLLLTWLCLRVQRPLVDPSSHSHSHSHSQTGTDADADANLARFAAPWLISNSRDRRGWILDPIGVALDKGIRGGAQLCKSVHAGEIRPGCIRGNHRHQTCNETFLIWGAETKFRVENPQIEGKAYAEVSIGADEVAVAASPSGAAHAIINVDPVRSTFFLGCKDSIIDYKSPTTDQYKVWEDLLTS